MNSLQAQPPKGWTEEIFESCGQQFKRAVDPDGCRWYWLGEWILNVPYFSRSTHCEENTPDDIAAVDHVTGTKNFPVTESGTILIGRRKIPATKWNH